MSDKPKDGGNVQKDFGPNIGNMANARSVISPSGLAITDLKKIETKEIEIVVPYQWTFVTNFSNGWDNVDPVDFRLKVMKHPDGQVEVRGHIGSGPLGVVAATLPTGYAPDETVVFACGDGTPNYRSTIAIDIFGQIYVNYGADPWIHVVYMPLDSRPIPLSCFPVYIKTELQNPVGVFVLHTDYGEGKRSPTVRSGAAANHCDWSFTKKTDGNYIKINNLTGLPYSQKTKVRFMIVGE